MYFWNINALAEELRRGSLSEKRKMQYLLAFLCIGIFHTSIGQVPEPSLKIFGLLVAFTFQAVAVFACFQANSAGDDRNFIERYVCLQVPLYIRFLAICSPGAIIFSLVTFHINMPAGVALITSILLALGVLWAYVALLRSYIARVAAPPAGGGLPAGPPASG